MSNKTQKLDLSFAQSATILAKLPERGVITVVQVGGGGTGSYMAQHLGRIMVALRDKGKRARAFIIDHDTVDKKNVGRQLFCPSEIGEYKAVCLARRYGTAWGLDVTAFPRKFDRDWFGKIQRVEHDDLTFIIGCVDNAAARKEITFCTHGHSKTPQIWWLDCGNHEDTGQVLLGNVEKVEYLKDAFPSKTICAKLPSPAIQHPELVIQKKEKKKRMSCAEMLEANLQSLNINAAVAVQAAEMLTRLVISQDLKRFACEINLAAGNMKSYYATPEQVAASIGQIPKQIFT